MYNWEGVLELHTFIKDLSDFSDELDLSFQLLKEYYLNFFFCAAHNVTALDKSTFVNLGNRFNFKSRWWIKPYL